MSTTSQRRARLRTATTAITAAAALAIAPLPATANAGTSPADRIGRIEAAQFEAEDYVRGLFFLSGPLVKALPELREGRAYANREGYVPDGVFEQTMLDTLEQLYPGSIDRFATVITSGDRVRVRQELFAMGDRFVGVLEHLRAAERKGPDMGINVAIGAVHVVAVALGMAVVNVGWLVNAVSVVNGAMVWWVEDNSSTVNQSPEAVADSIAIRLAR